MFQWYFKKVSKKFQGCFECVSRLFIAFFIGYFMRHSRFFLKGGFRIFYVMWIVLEFSVIITSSLSQFYDEWSTQIFPRKNILWNMSISTGYLRWSSTIENAIVNMKKMKPKNSPGRGIFFCMDGLKYLVSSLTVSSSEYQSCKLLRQLGSY